MRVMDENLWAGSPKTLPSLNWVNLFLMIKFETLTSILYLLNNSVIRLIQL